VLAGKMRALLWDEQLSLVALGKLRPGQKKRPGLGPGRLRFGVD